MTQRKSFGINGRFVFLYKKKLFHCLLIVFGVARVATLWRHKVEIGLVLLLVYGSAGLGTRSARAVATTSVDQRSICPGQWISGAVAIDRFATDASTCRDQRCRCSLPVIVNRSCASYRRRQDGRMTVGIVSSKDSGCSQGFVRLKWLVSIVGRWVIAPVDSRLILCVLIWLI